MLHARSGTPWACSLSQHSHASLWCLCAGPSCSSGSLLAGDDLQRSNLHSRCHVRSSEMQMCSTSPTQRTEPAIAVTPAPVQGKTWHRIMEHSAYSLLGWSPSSPPAQSSMTQVCPHLVVLAGSSPLPGLHPLNSSWFSSLFLTWWIFLLALCCVSMFVLRSTFRGKN